MTADELAQLKNASCMNFGPPPRCSATRCLQRSAPVKGSTVLTEQVLLSGCEAKGAVNDSIEQKGDYTRFARMKRGNLYFWKLSCLWIFSRFYEWQSAALRLSSPDLPPA
ncbi:hypothetical protein CNZ80_17245 [Salmonella enterica]|nr:hypothetical protein [Salmonella enterica subsp. enterica serovar Falkensee]EAW1949260.1 hypothetical protein [Salmonella enterica subsp. enterica]EBA9136733.1 hypothetical protein [Salmonella enterica]EBF5002409.1 hypothetical protein [Salmonella enterica]EBI4207807.1 hypothetical protein [Salmonella enterica]